MAQLTPSTFHVYTKEECIQIQEYLSDKLRKKGISVNVVLQLDATEDPLILAFFENLKTPVMAIKSVVTKSTRSSCDSLSETLMHHYANIFLTSRSLEALADDLANAYLRNLRLLAAGKPEASNIAAIRDFIKSL